MNQTTKRLVEDFKPILSVVCYRSDDSNYYLESHVINDNGDLLEGRPLAQDTMQAMIDVFYDENADKIKVGGLVPDSLLFYEIRNGGDYTMIWWRPEQVQNIFFNKMLHINSGPAHVPAMVFKASKSSLAVYALNESVRPGEDTQLYLAPYHNVGSRGGVCLGSAKAQKPKDSTYSNLIKYWEDMFWLSEFTHLHNTAPTKTNLNLIWKRLIEDVELKWSDLDELVPSTKPNLLKDLIKND